MSDDNTRLIEAIESTNTNLITALLTINENLSAIADDMERLVGLFKDVTIQYPYGDDYDKRIIRTASID